jgi:hypothetical protein
MRAHNLLLLCLVWALMSQPTTAGPTDATTGKFMTDLRYNDVFSCTECVGVVGGLYLHRMPISKVSSSEGE